MCLKLSPTYMTPPQCGRFMQTKKKKISVLLACFKSCKGKYKEKINVCF